MTPRSIELTEYERKELAPGELTNELGQEIYRAFRDKVAIDFPSPRTNGRWCLLSEGWVGSLPVTPELELRVAPKVPIANLFRMLEYAYDLSTLEFPGLTDMASVEDLFERLARVLAKRTLARAQRGLHASYVGEREALPYLRGSLDMRHRMRRPWEALLTCDYQDHTRDIEDNQILAWTFDRILRSGWCSEDGRSIVKRAFQAVTNVAAPVPFPGRACLGRLYGRLNADYEPLHALCRFFLENAGPAHERGGYRALPFLVNMAQLFERFVARWLERNLRPPLRVVPQERVVIDAEGEFEFRIDLVLYRDDREGAVTVIDTKYKGANRPSESDIHQVVSYAVSKGCDEAVLVYPRPLRGRSSLTVGQNGGKRVRFLCFDLSGDLDEAGSRLLAQLG